MYQRFKTWFLAIMFPLHYGGVYISFSEEMRDPDYPIYKVIYWLKNHAGKNGSDFRLDIWPRATGIPPIGVRILDKEVATMFKLTFLL